jgi:molybdopterin converting factor small subunit
MAIRVTVELLGLARLAAGQKEVSLDLADDATFRDIVRTLARQYPKMIGNVIQPDGETLQRPNILNLNARRMIRPEQMSDHPTEGDRIIFMSISAGG